jgi:hypothetical protein
LFKDKFSEIGTLFDLFNTVFKVLFSFVKLKVVFGLLSLLELFAKIKEVVLFI